MDKREKKVSFFQAVRLNNRAWGIWWGSIWEAGIMIG